MIKIRLKWVVVLKVDVIIRRISTGINNKIY